MIALLAAALASAAATASPVERCKVRMAAWCVLQDAVDFEVENVDSEKRTWVLSGSYLRDKEIRIIEDKACGAQFSDTQSKIEYLAQAEDPSDSVYVVDVKLSEDASCTLRIEIPAPRGRRDEVAYYTATSIIKACSDELCFGPRIGAISAGDQPTSNGS
jgi:hypothetical protein